MSSLCVSCLAYTAKNCWLLCMVISLASVNTRHGMDEQTACVGYPLSNVGRRGQFTSSLNMT